MKCATDLLRLIRLAMWLSRECNEEIEIILPNKQTWLKVID